MGWTYGLSPHLFMREDRGMILVFVMVLNHCWKFSLVFLTRNQVGVDLKMRIVAVWINSFQCLGSGKELLCGWKTGKLSTFWKELCGRVVLTRFSEHVHPTGMRLCTGTIPALIKTLFISTSAIPEEISLLGQTCLKQTTLDRVVLKDMVLE